MPPKPWKTLSTHPIYQNNWISVREDIAQLPNGRTTIYGVVSMHEAVGVLPFVDGAFMSVRMFGSSNPATHVAQAAEALIATQIAD